MNDVRPRHPEAQTMAAFIEGTLAPDQIAAVAEHLKGCGDCRTVVSETARFEREEEAREAPARARRRWWLLAVAAVLAAIAITLPLLRYMGTRNTSPIARLIEAAPRQHRFVEARLSGFPWAQLQAPPRGEAVPDPADLKLTGAAGEVLEKTADQHQPESRHATGVAYLLINRRNDGITALEQAVNGSSDAHTWNDLAAARYGVATQDEHPSQLPLALADADHALRLDPKSPESLFNRALILEHLGVRDQARKAWQAYLAVDGGSAWSVEARAHLRALETVSLRFDPKMLDSLPVDQLVREFPQEARTWGEGPMLASWADAEAANDAPHASTTLARARALADALAEFKGEYLLDDAVAAIERSSGSVRTALMSGQRIYRDARVAYSHRQPGAAESQFRHAAELFSRGGSPMAGVAEYYAANTVFDQNRREQAHGELALLLTKIDATRHRALSAQIHWELAVIANGAGDWGAATREADAASTIFRGLGERENAAVLDGIASVALDLIGETDLAWNRRLQCFAQLSATGERQKLGAALRVAASTLAAVDSTAAAAAIMNLTIDDDRGSDTAQLSLNEADEARFDARNGDLQRARQSLTNARATVARVFDIALREKVSRQIDLANATLGAAGDVRADIASLDRSIAFFTQRQASDDLAEAYLLRARAERSVGNDIAALADTRSALAEVEKQRVTIRDTQSRLRFLDVAGQILQETIDLRLSSGDVQGAFDAVDRSHLPPGVSAPNTASLAAAEDVALVEYAVLPHAVVAFCVTKDGLSAQRIEIDRHDLENRVASFVDLVRNRAPIGEIRASGTALHRLLIEPLLPRLSGVQEIILVPDRQIYALPFAALWDDGRKQYLVEEYTIRLATSATSRPEKAAPLQPALVIADPPTSQWPRLPASREEAMRIAALYTGAKMLTGEAATRGAFTAAAGGSALIHFAGHANSDAFGSYAALLFAANSSDSGVVGANDVARLHLERHPLVVLAACGTFRGNTQHVAGMSSIALAFLLAGARSVVGTLWEIDDDVSAPLFLRLHEHLHAGMSPARALRQAQGDLLHSTDPRLAHPATWGPVESLTND